MKKIVLALTAVLGLVASSLIPTFSVGANSYFGGNGRITFYSPVTLDDTTQEVYTINPDGTGLAQVTSNVLADANPQWSPLGSGVTGAKIAFDHYVDGTNQQDIYTQSFTSNGSIIEPPQVVAGANTTEREFDPSWSPDGGTIAYHRRGVVGGNGPYQIFTVDTAVGTPVRVTDDDGFSDTEPTWRKDGAYVVFGHRELLGDANSTADDRYRVAIATPTASATPIIIDSGDNVGDAVGAPQWSPTANKVVYVKGGDFWIYNQDTSTKVQLTTVGNLSAPTWSPDGRYIATGSGSSIKFFSATTGELVHTTNVTSGGSTDYSTSDGIVEVDWARATAPSNTVHECTTYVNEDCTQFTPSIPSACQSVTSSASHGTPGYTNGARIFTPEANYVGTDTYVYTYEDGSFNQITCTVNITVLPRSPDSGRSTRSHTWLYLMGLIPASAAGLWVYKKRFH